MATAHPRESGPVYLMPRRSNAAWSFPFSPSPPWRPRKVISARRHSSMTFGPKKQSDWSGRDALTAARSGSSVLIFFTISRPWSGRVKTSSRFSGACSSPINTSRRNASCPFSSNVRQMPAAEESDTSRSVLRPPANTIIFIINNSFYWEIMVNFRSIRLWMKIQRMDTYRFIIAYVYGKWKNWWTIICIIIYNHHCRNAVKMLK